MTGRSLFERTDLSKVPELDRDVKGRHPTHLPDDLFRHAVEMNCELVKEDNSVPDEGKGSVDLVESAPRLFLTA